VHHDIDKTKTQSLRDQCSWVKPPGARCTTQWGRGVVTKVNSRNNVEVNHVPRHVLDLRKVAVPDDGDDAENDQHNVAFDEASEPRYPQRVRRVPAWQGDYVVG